MKIKLLINSYFHENTYIFELNNHIFVIDPGSDVDNIISILKDKKLDYILLTHGHMDHIYSVKKLNKKYHCPIYCSNKDLNYIKGNIILDYSFDKNNYNFEFIDYKNFKFEGIKIIDTPGHSKGSVCIYLEKENIIFSGDTLFKDSFGRFDFLEGDFCALKKSINYLFSLNENIKIYPGHGKNTTIKDEKINNIIKFY